MKKPRLPLPLLLLLFGLRLPGVRAIGNDSSGTLTIVAIVLGSVAGVGGIAVIAWYCYKSTRTDKQVTPKPPPPKPVPPLPQQQQQQQVMLVNPAGMQGFMVPTGMMMVPQNQAFPMGQQQPMMGFATAAPSPVPPQALSAPSAPQPVVEDLENK